MLRRIWAIWACPGIRFSKRVDLTEDWLFMVWAFFLPKKLRYWVTMTEIAKATRDDPITPTTTAEDVLAKLDY